MTSICGLDPARVALVAAACAVCCALLPGAATSAPEAATGKTVLAGGAAVWVAPSGSDDTCARHVPTRPCRTFGRAYQVALPGDTVAVAAGSYPGQSIGGWSRSKSGTSRITFAATGPVTLSGTLYVRASNVVVRGVADLAPTGVVIGEGGSCSAFPCSFATRNVTLDRFRVQTMTVTGDTILIENGSVGPHDVCTQGGNEDGIVVSGLGSGPGPTWTPSNRVTIKNVTVHDITNSGCSNHVDGIQLFSWHNFSLLDSRIYNTDSSLVLGYSFDEHNPAQLQGIVIANNAFGRVPHPGHGVTLGAASGDPRYRCGSGHELVENNTFYGNVGADIACGPGAVFRNNIVLASSACVGPTMEWTWSHNIFAQPGPGCARTRSAKVCTPRFADPSHRGGGAALAAGDTCARDAIPTSPRAYPSRDARGVKRPQGRGVDAGAYEVPLR